MFNAVASVNTEIDRCHVIHTESIDPSCLRSGNIIGPIALRIGEGILSHKMGDHNLAINGENMHSCDDRNYQGSSAHSVVRTQLSSNVSAEEFQPFISHH